MGGQYFLACFIFFLAFETNLQHPTLMLTYLYDNLGLYLCPVDFGWMVLPCVPGQKWPILKPITETNSWTSTLFPCSIIIQSDPIKRKDTDHFIAMNETNECSFFFGNKRTFYWIGLFLIITNLLRHPERASSWHPACLQNFHLWTFWVNIWTTLFLNHVCVV